MGFTEELEDMVTSYFPVLILYYRGNLEGADYCGPLAVLVLTSSPSLYHLVTFSAS